MANYIIKKAADLLPKERETILYAWSVEEWKYLSVSAFKRLFQASEFHLLVDNTNTILSVARINFDFRLKINDEVYALPELVGFVSVQRGKGYGSTLLKNMVTNLAARHIEALGFCEKELRPFYEKAGTGILYGQAQFIMEPVDNKWIPGTDDDILNLTLSPIMVRRLENLTAAQPAYLVNNFS